MESIAASFAASGAIAIATELLPHLYSHLWPSQDKRAVIKSAREVLDMYRDTRALVGSVDMDQLTQKLEFTVYCMEACEANTPRMEELEENLVKQQAKISEMLTSRLDGIRTLVIQSGVSSPLPSPISRGTPMSGVSTPHVENNEERELVIQGALMNLDENPDAVETTTSTEPVGSSGTTTTLVTQSSVSSALPSPTLRGASLGRVDAPHTEHDEGMLEEDELAIQEAPADPRDKNSRVAEVATSIPPLGSDGTAEISFARSACQRLIERAFAPDQLYYLIETVFSSTDETDVISSICGDDAQSFIDVVDKALDSLDFSPPIRKKVLKALYRTCGRNASLPKSLRIPPCYDRTRRAMCGGGYAEVWKGSHCGRDVAVKVLKTYSNSDSEKIIGRFCKEVVTWKYLRHPNVLPLIGVTETDAQFGMVSEWMENGNINAFMKTHLGADRVELLRGVARGLIYVHSQEIIHGDLKGANILVDQTGHARLADFGLVKIISDSTDHASMSLSTDEGTARWMSPEIIDPQRFGIKKNRHTKSSDCYALGMVIYETVSGRVPFHQVLRHGIGVRILNGERPLREAGFTDSLWKMVELCWKPQPGDRPSIEDVLQCLEIEQPYFGLDAEVEEGGKDGEDGDDLHSWDVISFQVEEEANA